VTESYNENVINLPEVMQILRYKKTQSERDLIESQKRRLKLACNGDISIVVVLFNPKRNPVNECM